MRIAGLGLALVACAQLTLLSSPAFADDSSASASASVSTDSSSASTSTSASPSTSTPSSPAPADNAKKEKTGWIILGVGGAVAIGGIVLDIVGTQVGNDVPGQTGTTTSTAKTNFFWGGSTMIVAGLLAGVYGGSMILDARKAQEPQPAQAPTDTGHTDNTAKAAQAALSRAPAFTLPLVKATF